LCCGCQHALRATAARGADAGCESTSSARGRLHQVRHVSAAVARHAQLSVRMCKHWRTQPMLEAPRAAPGAGRRSVVATGGGRRAHDRPARRPGRRGRRAAGAAACARLLGRRADRAGGGTAACPLRQALTRIPPPTPAPATGPEPAAPRAGPRPPGGQRRREPELGGVAAARRPGGRREFPRHGCAARTRLPHPPPLPPPARAAPGRSGTHAHLRERRPAERPARRTGGRCAAGLPRAHDCLTARGAALLGSVRRAYAGAPVNQPPVTAS